MAKKRRRNIKTYHKGGVNVSGEIFRRKQNIGYLSNPSVSLGFMCHNMIKLRGYKTVESSFEKISGQSDDIMVVDNYSDDADELSQLCKKYNFNYVSVEPSKYNFKFDVAKISNMIVKRAKYNIVVRLSPEILYPYNFVWYISTFFRRNNPREWFIGFKVFNLLKNGAVQATPMEEWTIYKPYFIESRGWDERTTYFRGEDHYSYGIMDYVYGCKKHIPEYFYLAHRDHNKKKGYEAPEVHSKLTNGWNWKKQLELLKRNINNRKLVENSLF